MCLHVMTIKFCLVFACHTLSLNLIAPSVEAPFEGGVAPPLVDPSKLNYLYQKVIQSITSSIVELSVTIGMESNPVTLSALIKTTPVLE